jgi:hypothetical protein
MLADVIAGERPSDIKNNIIKLIELSSWKARFVPVLMTNTAMWVNVDAFKKLASLFLPRIPKRPGHGKNSPMQ